MVTETAVLAALTVVKDPDLHQDIVTLGFIKNLRIDGGRVAFTIELTTPACPVKDQMRDQAHAAVSALPGVTAVEVEMTASVRAVASPEAGRAPVEGVKNIIAVGAGKGGVGKTTVAVNLAIALAKCGSRVGIIDGDIYGPNVPIMLGINTQLTTDGKKILPAEKHGLQVISMGFMTSDDAPVIWRGPMLHGAIQQFFREVRWDNLDYLIVDMPPGTGDVALSLSQTVPVAGSIVVTTPQQVSLADSRRAIRMYQKLNIPTLGIIENMSHFVCPNCSHEADIFGHGGGQKMAEDMNVTFLGRVPIYQPIREGSDNGVPLVLSEPESPAAKAFMATAERVAAEISIASYKRAPIPLTPISYVKWGQTPFMNIPFTQHTLENGLRVIIHEDRRLPMVAVNLWYHVGSKNEHPGPHRVRASLRASDVRRLAALRQGLLPSAAGSGRGAERIDESRSHQLLGGRADQRARSRAVDGVRSDGLPAARSHDAEVRDAARGGAERAAPELREPAVRPRRRARSWRHCFRRTTRTTG